MENITFDKQLWQLFITAKKSILDKNTSQIQVDEYNLDNDGKFLSFQLNYNDPWEIVRLTLKQYLDIHDLESKEIDNILQFSISKKMILRKCMKLLA